MLRDAVIGAAVIRDIVSFSAENVVITLKEGRSVPTLLDDALCEILEHSLLQAIIVASNPRFHGLK